mgnify:CR=1 FL=1
METKRIRLLSRAAALMLAALAALAVSLLRVERAPPQYNAVTIVSYIIATPAPESMIRPSAPRDPPTPGAAVAAGDALAPPRLWSYNSRGEIVFDHAEHFHRCVAARAARHNEADCPEPHDPHPLALQP